MGPLVCYSLAMPQPARLDLIQQLEWSTASLRRHSPSTRVVLFNHGAIDPRVASICARQRVELIPRPGYVAQLDALSPRGSAALARYPLMHKFLLGSALDRLAPTQVLVCDLDTLFFGDVRHVFEAYSAPDIVAREEVCTSRSAAGPNPHLVDEQLLAHLGRAEGIAPPPPFNLGFVLLNHGTWTHLGALDGLLLDYAWRFVSWMALNPLPDGNAFGEFAGLDAARAALTPHDAARALAFPSSNRWILDEVALWMTLGHLPGLRYADFHAQHVLQGAEFMTTNLGSANAIACHYFSQNQTRIGDWLQNSLQSA